MTTINWFYDLIDETFGGKVMPTWIRALRHQLFLNSLTYPIDQWRAAVLRRIAV